MKKLLSIALITVTFTTSVFAQNAELQRPGDATSRLSEARRSRDTKIQDLDSAINDIQSAMNLLGLRNPQTRRLLRSAIFKIEDVQIKIFQEQQQGPPHENTELKTIVISLLSSNKRLYTAKSTSRLLAIQQAQEKCVKKESFGSNCKTDEDKLKTEVLNSNDDTMNVVSLESSFNRLFIAESKSLLEAIQQAQDKCIAKETFVSNCTADATKLRSETYSTRMTQYYVNTCSLQSSNSRLYIGQAKTKVEAVVLAQAKCLASESFSSDCKAVLAKIVCE